MYLTLRSIIALAVLAVGLTAEPVQAQYRRGVGVYAGPVHVQYGYYGNYYSSPYYGYHNLSPYRYYGPYVGYRNWGAPVYIGSYPPAYQYPYYGNTVAVTPLVPRATTTESNYGDVNLARMARLRVFVPTPETRVVINGTQTTSTGTERVFESPSLDPGKYTYTVQATWVQSGKEVTQTQNVDVRPGSDTAVIFKLEGEALPPPQ